VANIVGRAALQAQSVSASLTGTPGNAGIARTADQTDDVAVSTA
jgi:hypothetical protein